MGVSDDDDFTVELGSNPDDVLTVRLDGELDLAHADWVEDTLRAAAEHHRHVVVQLDAVTFIDSTGIRALQTLQNRGRELGLTVNFEQPSPAVRRALKAAGVSGALD